MSLRTLVVCVPARNEAARLPRLLEALALQTVKSTVVVALNNTTDNSLGAIAKSCEHYPHLSVIIDEITFAPENANAGHARRRAMDVAAKIAGPAGLLLTTDADTRPPNDWIAQNIDAIATGRDLVGGRIVLDEDEPMLLATKAVHALAECYWASVREIEDEIDPIAWDPQPRHGDHTGASLCITVSAYRGCGGVPLVPSGEDRALVRAVLRQGGRLAHPIGIWTRVSPRLDGRALGGMAAHMKRLHEDTVNNKSICLPSFEQWRRRAEWRRTIRAKGGGALVAELESDFPAMELDMILTDDAGLGKL